MRRESVEQPIVPPSSRSASVVMGSQTYLATLFRLIAMELYKLRRRSMSKALLIAGFGLIGLVFLLTAVPLWTSQSKPNTAFTPPFCNQQPQIASCLKVHRAPTEAERALYKQEVQEADAASLRPPGSIERFGLFEMYVLPILIMILVGSMVGGDYSLGTIRLLFTRGPSRLQFILAKIGTALFCIVLGYLALLCFATLEGYLLSLQVGSSPTSPGLGMPFILTFILIGIVGWFTYAMMALLCGVVGRSTVAGIVGPLVWFSLEPVVGAMINRFAENISGGVGEFMRAVPEYFVSNTISALLQNTHHTLVASVPASPLSNTYAWTMLIVYSLLFILLSIWLTIARDVTN